MNPNCTVESFLSFCEEMKAKASQDASIMERFESLRLGEIGKAEGKSLGQSAMDMLAEDAETTVRLISDQLQEILEKSPTAKVLEVGGGVGWVSAWLQREGVQVWSLEPSGDGHGGYYEIGRQLLSILGLKQDRWFSMRADEAESLGVSFDFVFSNNVLEHIDNLRESMQALSNALAPGGIMRHNCPNYRIPFEPHFGIPLVPGAPNITKNLFSSVDDEDLWNSINFITAGEVNRLARSNRLASNFDSLHLYNTFKRLETDPGFIKKHELLAKLYKVFSPLGVFRLLKFWPAAWATPMQFTLTKQD